MGRYDDVPQAVGKAPFDCPWKLEGLMRMMYKGDQRSMRSIAREFGCSDKTVEKWLDEHGIEKRSRRMSYHLRDGGVQHYFNSEGYEYIRTEHKGRATAVPVHKLVAIAHGADPHKMFGGDDVVHHQDGTKCNNAPANLDWTMTNTEHAKAHMTYAYKTEA